MKERWPEMLEYQQKVQAMTDLERAQEAVREWVNHEHCELRLIGKSQAHLSTLTPIIECALAAARREGAARAAEKAYTNGFRRGAEEMRERAAQLAHENGFGETAAAIRALPLTPEGEA